MRGLCKSCATVVCRQGRLAEYPAVRQQRPLVEAVEEYLIVRGRPGTAEDKAAALGYGNSRAMRKMVERARSKGLLR
jgi:hypothetical protein